MLLHTPVYLLFLVGVAFAYWIVQHPVIRRRLLLAASAAFYAAFDLRFVAVLAVMAAATYGLSLAVRQGARKRLALWVGISVNLGALTLFKYANFFLETVGSATALNILLPIGISFYAFQAISYLVEVSQGKIEPAPNFWDFALYLAFFPKLIAGPIVRPSEFFKQVANPLPLSREDVKAAGMLLTMGLVKKLLIADSLAAMADTAYRAASLPTGGGFPSLLFWQGFYLYAFQIYADFSGYTDIALGSARLLGFRLPPNFDRPYFAATLGDFWNRWHLSLTGWFREMLFFPVSRGLLRRVEPKYAKVVQVASNLITMTLIGLWHGASWPFVAWGVWHGALLSIERLANFRPTGQWRRVVTTVITFHLVALGWVLFRAGSFDTAGRFLAGMASLSQLYWWPAFIPPIILTAGLTLGMDWLRPYDRPAWRPVVLAASLIVLVGLAILQAARGSLAQPFIYGRF